MSVYEGFAQVYDKMMEDVPYDVWMENIEKMFEIHNIKPRIIADLGCGTGTITLELARRGYDMIGIDLSTEMLQVARDKALEAECDVLFLQQDMTELDLFGTVDCVLSTCDSLNYIETEEELLNVFKRVNMFLEPKGLFIFDMNTIHKFKNVLSTNTFAGTYDNSAFIWDNYFDEVENINEYQLTLFVKDEDEKAEQYHRYEETHYEFAYETETIIQLLEHANMKLEAIYDEHGLSEPHSQSERIYFVAREQGKEID